MPEFRVRTAFNGLIYCITYNPIQMNNLALKVFDNEQFGRVRTISKDEHPWFVGVDVARALGYKIPRDAVNKKVWKQNKDICRLYTPAATETSVCDLHTQGQDRDADEFVCDLHTNPEGGNPNTTIINEAVVYQLIVNQLQMTRPYGKFAFRLIFNLLGSLKVVVMANCGS